MIRSFIDGRKVSVDLQHALFDSVEDIHIVENLKKAHVTIDRLTLSLDTAVEAIRILCNKLGTDPQLFYDLLNSYDSKFITSMEQVYKDKE